LFRNKAEGNFQVEVQSSKLEGSKYRQFVNTGKVDWCKLLMSEGKARKSSMGLRMLNLMIEPLGIPKCSFMGKIELLNIRANKALVTLVPNGIYKNSYRHNFQ